MSKYTIRQTVYDVANVCSDSSTVPLEDVVTMFILGRPMTMTKEMLNKYFTTCEISPYECWFSDALILLKGGIKVCRSGWNGKGMWLELSEYGEGAMYKDKPLLPHIMMKTADNKYVPWLASQTDILATDWMVFNGK